MANPKPDISGLLPHQFTPESARRAARKSARARAENEALKQVTVKVFARQHKEFARRGDNLSALIRRLLDEHLSG